MPCQAVPAGLATKQWLEIIGDIGDFSNFLPPKLTATYHQPTYQQPTSSPQSLEGRLQQIPL